MTPRTLLLALLTALALAVSPAQAGGYDPYAFLIGEWNVSAGGGAPFAVARFTWGPHHSYIWHSLSMLGAAGEERTSKACWCGTACTRISTCCS